MKDITEHFINGFSKAASRRSGQRRVGAELKFPFVDRDGNAVDYAAVETLWKYLERRGWTPKIDAHAGGVIGATRPGPMNDTLAGCETGFCKVEFSLAHVADIHELARMTDELRSLLRDFSDETGYMFLGYGIHPVTRPGQHLLMKKGRNVFWDKVFGSNRMIPPEEGDDVHLFTVSASSQAHIDVSLDEAIKAVNVFNGFSGAQVALTANSNVWKGELDDEHECVGEMFWDWWIPGTDRYGVPPEPFSDFDDYMDKISRLKPVYVKREGHPVGLLGYGSFAEYFSTEDGASGVDADGNTVGLTPEPADIDQHGTFYWYNARISRYYTLENRVNDQQPPEDMNAVAALTMGLASALDEAAEVVGAHKWNHLRETRLAACRDGMEAKVNGLVVRDLSAEMLEVATLGLKRRGLGEEEYLDTFKSRLSDNDNPADRAAKLYESGGMSALLDGVRV